MAIVRTDKTSVLVDISPTESYLWAHREGNLWPASTLSGKRVRALFDEHGLVELDIYDESNLGKPIAFDPPSHEFNALVADVLAKRLPKKHPAYYVTVGGFGNAVCPM